MSNSCNGRVIERWAGALILFAFFSSARIPSAFVSRIIFYFIYSSLSVSQATNIQRKILRKICNTQSTANRMRLLEMQNHARQPHHLKLETICCCIARTMYMQWKKAMRSVVGFWGGQFCISAHSIRNTYVLIKFNSCPLFCESKFSAILVSLVALVVSSE